MANTACQKIQVFGLLKDVTFHLARCCAEDLHIKDKDKFPEPQIDGKLEFEWDLFIEEKRKELRNETWVFKDKAIIFVNGKLIGGPMQFTDYAKKEYNYEDFRPIDLYKTLAEKAYVEHMNSRSSKPKMNREYVYMDVSIGDKDIGTLLVELFSDIVPKTCQNFKALCTGEEGESEQTEYKLHYKDTLLHRVVKNGWVQGGDIWMKRGDGGESIHGPVFEDENFAVSYERRGMLGMANKGRHTNGSQFFITLQPAKWMETKYVCFGQVVEGTETLKAIEQADTMNERPMKDVKITDCGIKTFEF